MHTISNMKALLENHPESGIYIGTLESGREYILYRQEGSAAALLCSPPTVGLKSSITMKMGSPKALNTSGKR